MSAQTNIHPSSIVEHGAQLDMGVSIGPFCIVGKNVSIGKNTQIHSHVVVTGHTQLGEANEIFPFASIGHAPQDLKYKGENTKLIIGNRNKIRESVTLQPGTVQALGATTIGDDNLFMAYTHVAHDCIVGNQNILANGAQLSGHVTLGNGTIIGGLAGIHQFCAVGDFAMAAGGAKIVEDLPPYCMAQGDRAALRGLNIVGLKRKGFSATQVRVIKECYKVLFYGNSSSLTEALKLCKSMPGTEDPIISSFLDFIEHSKRGVMRPVRKLHQPEPENLEKF